MTATTATPPPYIRRPRAVSTSYDPRQVGLAYNFPLSYTGRGAKVGIIELGGGCTVTEVDTYLKGIGVQRTGQLTLVGVDGAKSKSDGPDGADGEVLLDVEVVCAIAPAANVSVYFAPNTDKGFLDAIVKAGDDGCDIISISWGGPESSWDTATIKAYDQAFAKLRAAGVIILAAAGDSGSKDGTSANAADFPASSPNVIACGGTELKLDAKGNRVSEVVWDISDTSSATGGGVSAVFQGRSVPDIAGNASPNTGYRVLVDGQDLVIGGTSAVAPLFAGLFAVLHEAIGGPVGKTVDVLNTFATNPSLFFDVTSGDNGGFRAGPGRDNVSGWGVLDGGRLLKVLTDPVVDPAPIPSPVDPVPTPPAPAPVPVPAPVDPPAPVPAPPAPPVTPVPMPDPLADFPFHALDAWAKAGHERRSPTEARAVSAYRKWRAEAAPTG